MIAEVIREDTQLDPDTSMMLAMGLLGMAQTAARHWLHSPAPISQESAARAMSALAWRGISNFPLTAHPPRPDDATTPSADSAPATGSPLAGGGTAAKTRSKGRSGPSA
jgi:hypothetical protein